jgi:glycosyltransferase involved in cell wall biosynthesis
MTCGSFESELFKIKYQYLFQSIKDHFEIVDIFNGQLNWYENIINSLQSFNKSPTLWRQKSYANFWLFRKLSKKAQSFILNNQHKADLVFLHGITYDAIPTGCTLKSIAYSDYTYQLSAQHKEYGRFPFEGNEVFCWLEFEKRILDKLDLICTHSRFTANSLKKHYNIPVEKIRVVGGGLNFEKLPAAKKYELDSPSRAFQLLFIGKEFYRKGGDILIEAFHLARKKIPDMNLNMLTHLPPGSQFNLDNIRILNPSIISDRKRFSENFQNADAFALTSRMETWGDVLIEAMAFELPCIGIRQMAMAEIIDHQKTGLLVNVGEVEELSQAIIKLAQNIELRRSLGQTGRQKVAKQFIWSQVVKRIFRDFV